MSQTKQLLSTSHQACWERCGLMVSAQHSWLSGLGWRPSYGHCAESQGLETLLSKYLFTQDYNSALSAAEAQREFSGWGESAERCECRPRATYTSPGPFDLVPAQTSHSRFLHWRTFKRPRRRKINWYRRSVRLTYFFQEESYSSEMVFVNRCHQWSHAIFILVLEQKKESRVKRMESTVFDRRDHVAAQSTSFS